MIADTQLAPATPLPQAVKNGRLLSAPHHLTGSPSQSVPHPLDPTPLPLPDHINRADLLDAFLSDDRASAGICTLFGISLGQLHAWATSAEARAAMTLSHQLADIRAAHIAAQARLKTLRTLGDLASAAPHPGTSVEADTRTLNAHTRAREAARKSALALHRIAGECPPAPLVPPVPDKAPAPAPGGGGVGAADGGGNSNPSSNSPIDPPSPRVTLIRRRRRSPTRAPSRKSAMQPRAISTLRRLFAGALHASLFGLLLVATVSAQCPLIYPGPVLDAGGEPTAIVLHDFNSDGRTDIAVVSNDDEGVSVLLGLGGGAFAPRALFPAGHGPRSMAAADFDGDGTTDIVTGDFFGSTLSFLRGLPDGSFEAPAASPAPYPYDIAAADFNGDGRPDIAATNPEADQVVVLIGRGDGVFDQVGAFPTGESPQAVAIADFNSDGVADLAVGNYYGSGVTVLLGVGDGTFGEPAELDTFIFWVTDVAIADLTGDGIPDIVAATLTKYDGIWLFPGTGTGAFSEPVTLDAGSGGSSSIIVADLNGDALPDLAMTDDTPAEAVSVLTAKPGGEYSEPVSFPVGYDPSSVAAGDFDGDGSVDLAVCDGGSGTVSQLFGRGDGSYVTAPVADVDGTVDDAVLADFNEDGMADLALIPALRVVLGRGDGTFSDPVRYDTPAEIAAVIAADMNGDGHLDLALANHGREPYTAGNVSILLGIGDGTFAESHEYAGGGGPTGLAAADLDSNGDLDLALAVPTDDAVAITLGDGAGKVGRRTKLPVGDEPLAVAAGDFNGDGLTDLVSANGGPASTTVSVLLGRGGAAFDASREWTAARRPFRVVVSDLDSDGHADIIASCAGNVPADTGGVAVLLGRGDGTFSQPIVHALDHPTADIAPGDFNADGRPDIAALSGSTIRLFFGRGDGTLEPPLAFNARPFPRAIALGDLNADGRLDVIAAGSYLGMSVLLQRDHCSAVCPPDCDHNGVLDTADYFCFQTAWRARDPYADYDKSGRFDVNDFLQFQNAFVHGCR